MEPGNRQQMRKIAGPERLDRPLPERAAVPGGDGGREAADIAGQHGNDPLGQDPAQGKDTQRKGVCLGRCDGHDRPAGITDRAKPLEPGVETEIETAGLGRAHGRRQARRGHDPLSRAQFGVRPVERDAHTLRQAFGRGAAQPDLIERDARHIRGRAVEADHPPLDRSVVMPADHRRGLAMRARTRKAEPGRDQRHDPAERGKSPGPDQRDAKAQRADAERHHMNHDRRFKGEQEIAADADRQADRRPGEKMPLLAQQQPVRHAQDAHACPPHPGQIDTGR